MGRTILHLMVILCAYPAADSARILAVFPFQAKSHYTVYEPLLKRLSEVGHQVVAVSHFPQKVTRSNFTDVDISSTLPSMVNSLPLSEFEDFAWWRAIKYMTGQCGVRICETVLSYPGLKRIILERERFDVYIVEIFASDCFLGIAHALDIPIVVGAMASVGLPWANEIIRNPENPSYIPNWFSGFTDRMTLQERLVNFVRLLITKIYYRVFSDNPSYEIAREHLGKDLPDFYSLRSRISMILANGHPAVSTARPLAPGFKQVAGIHISDPEPLPPDLQDYLDSQASNGVIYFSLGSQIDSSTMPSQVFAALYRAFEQVPQQILWTCPTPKMPRLPKNVKCIGWAPQLSLLCHPNVRLFISHGGLLGLQEAIYCAVPILGMPLFGDHYLNMAYFRKKGLALELDFSRLTYEQLSDAMNKLLTNQSYTENVRKASLQFKDRLVPPLEESVYWIEYLLRHGPDSLRLAAADLPLYQYLLVDVLLVLGTLIFVVSWLVYKLLRGIFRGGDPPELDPGKKRN